MIAGGTLSKQTVNRINADLFAGHALAEFELLINKAAANGYASLDGSAKIPIAQIPQTSITIAESQVTNLVSDLAAINSAIALRELLSNKGAASGYASLDGSTKVPIAQVPTGQTGSTVPFGNDSRFTDSRTPTAHASSHQDGGSDEIIVTGLSGLLADTQTPTPATTADVFAATSNVKAITPLSLATRLGDGGNLNQGATVTMGNGSSFNLITSVVTITAFAFTNDQVGRKATLKFATSRDITYNATSLILPTAATITTDVGDEMEVESLGGGNFRVNWYTRADGSALLLASQTDVLNGSGAGFMSSRKAVTPDSLSTLWAFGGDLTSGATITLGLGGSFKLRVSVVSITSFVFTNDYVGRRAVILFDTVRTLTHNATSLILPGGANITTAQGDVMEIQSLFSGNFRVNWYQRANGTALALSSTAVTPGSYGSASNTLSAAVDAFGRLTALSAQAIAIAESQVTNLTTDLANRELTANKNVASGYAPLDSGVKVPTANMQTNLLRASVSLTVDGGGGVPTTGSKGFITVPYAGTITNWYIIGDQSGSAVIDVKRSSTSIIGAGNKPTLSSAQRANAVVASWTSTAIAVNDELEFNLDSASTLTRINLVVEITRT